jgi:hypothetical protein
MKFIDKILLPNHSINRTAYAPGAPAAGYRKRWAIE